MPRRKIMMPKTNDLIDFSNTVAEDMKDQEFARELFLRERKEQGSNQKAMRNIIELMDLNWFVSAIGHPFTIDRVFSFLKGRDLDDDELATFLVFLGVDTLN